ncbi:thymidine kinase [Candidatus Saccharibacteria bacterium]|nr:thymidine kinase [Candidatus Saccharibacteria bacterium]MBR0416079.1 thymidine kinase [Candidatus Saccharibacteria bacterium]
MAKLYFRYGAMGCGKTMQLLQVAFNYEERGQKVCVIKPKTDTKNGDKLLTRIGPERETDFCFTKKDDLLDIVTKKYSDVDCVLVDEAQFLTKEQVDQLLKITIKLNIPVMAYGLRLNFRMEDGGFDGATRLLQVAHDIEEIKTICECGRKATLNCRFLNDKIVIDGPDVLIDDGKSKIEYRALCPACFYKKVEEAKKCLS